MSRAAALLALALLLALLGAGCLGAQGAGTPVELRVGDLSIAGLVGGRGERLTLGADGPAGARVDLAALTPTTGGVLLESHDEAILLDGAALPAQVLAGPLHLGSHVVAVPAQGLDLQVTGSAGSIVVTPGTLTHLAPNGALASFTLSAPALEGADGALLGAGPPLLRLEVVGRDVLVTVLDRELRLGGVEVQGAPLAHGFLVVDASGHLVLRVQAVEGDAGAAALLTGPAVARLAPHADALAVLLARGEGSSRVGALVTEQLVTLVDARSGSTLARLALDARPTAVAATDASVEVQGPAGRIVAAGVDGVRVLAEAGDATLLWHALTGALLLAASDAPLVAGTLSDGTSPTRLFELPASGQDRFLLDALAPLADEGGLLVARLVGPVALPASLPLEVSLEPVEPFDPDGPWTVGAVRARLGADGVGEFLLSGPLVLRTGPGGFDRADVVAPTGAPIARVACSDGACTLTSALGTVDLPVGTLRVDGDLHQGRPTGLRLVGPDGRVALRIELFGEQGLRATGSALTGPLTLGPLVALEGDPRDLDRARITLPDGTPVLDAALGGSGLGTVSIAGQALPLPLTGARLEGDPLTDADARLHLTFKEQTVSIRLASAAGAFAPLAEPTGPVAHLRSPLGPRDVDLTLISGPVRLHGDGALSPRFDVVLRALVPNATGYDQGRALLDGTPIAELVPAGNTDGKIVFLGRAPAWLLPQDHGALATLVLEFSRDIAPGLGQEHAPVRTNLTFDSEGPPAPDPTPDSGLLVWVPVPGADHYEAEAGREEAPLRPIPVNDTVADPPDVPGNWSGRVRSVDPNGNQGPWSQMAHWTVAPDDSVAPPPAPQLDVVEPVAGSTVHGVVHIEWRPDPSIALVTVEVSSDGGATWTTIARSGVSPIEWDTRAYADGPYTLRVRAEGPSGTTSRIVADLTVDNLSSLHVASGPAFGALTESEMDGEGFSERAGTSTPLPLAMTTVLGVLALAGAVLWVGPRRRAR